MDEQRNEYRTGPTEPRPKHRGIITILLVLVILLCGLVSILGIMNIHLFRLLDEKGGAAPLSFSKEETTPTQVEDTVTVAGMTLQEIPQDDAAAAGLYVAHVQEGSAADQAGVIAGDVLQNINGTQVTSLDALESRLAGPRCPITVCRGQEHIEITLEVNTDESHP